MNLSDLIGGEAPVWVSGRTYAVGQVVRDPADWYFRYVRVAGGAGTTNPINDLGNWRPDGGRPIKSVQRGVIQLVSSVPSASATIAAVAPGKTELRFLGANVDDNQGSWGLAHITLTNATTVTATRQQANSLLTNVSWELTEYY